MHLQHWERIFNGFGHITSGITLEFIGCIVFAVVLVLYFLMMRRAEDGMAPKWCGVLAIVVGLALPVITGMSYLMASLPSWNTPLLPAYYLANTVFMGGLTALVIAGLTNDDGAKDLSVRMALAGGASAFLSVGGSTVHAAGRSLTNVLHIVDYASGTLPKGVQPRDFDTPSDWAAQTVSDAAAAGIVPEALQNGYQKNITRKEFCQVIEAMLKQEMTDYDSRLYQTGITYNQAREALTDTWDISVINCYRFGIIDGVGNHKFSPNESLTREQAAKILRGAAKTIGLSGSEANNSWADASQISSWAHEGINYVVGAGIMNGTGENRFEPQGLFTREQAIATVYRML